MQSRNRTRQPTSTFIRTYFSTLKTCVQKITWCQHTIVSRYCAHNFAMCCMYMFSCSYRHSFHWRRKMDDLIADAAISLVPSSKQTGHCTNTCQSVIVLFTSVSHVWVCLHRAQVQSPALREQKRPARSVLTPSHPHSMDGAVGTGRPQTRCDENTAPVKPAASRNAVATARASPGQRRRHDVFVVLHVMPGLDRNRDLLRPPPGAGWKPKPK